MIIFWMILMKFKGYTLQLTIIVKTDEMGIKGFPEEFFLRNRYGKKSYFFKSRSSWALYGARLHSDYCL
jgi:hypothetical protein